MKALLLTVLLMGLAPLAEARPHVNADAAEMAARVKVNASLAHLTVSDDWQIFVLSEKDWREGLSQNRRQTDFVVGSAYTITEKHITYLNATWVMANNEERIAHTLAHEWGHILCDCFDEKMADRQGQRIIH